ncbi:hypothetical protein GCM10010279_31530 [Streptomyces mutabilis]|nr:hypothetical protein GCM10010279_31530 [Streptomyces mutabilis]
MDGRRRRVLAYGGASRFHPASVHNIAELIRLAAPRPGTRVLNAVDDEAPTVAEIGAAIDAVMGVETGDVLLDGPPAGGVGDTPWSVPVPVVCDMTAARRELGYRPVVEYAETLPEIEERLAGRRTRRCSGTTATSSTTRRRTPGWRHGGREGRPDRTGRPSPRGASRGRYGLGVACGAQVTSLASTFPVSR